MTRLLDRTSIDGYVSPALQALGSLRALTEGAGPDGEPVVMATGLVTSGAPTIEARRVGRQRVGTYERPALEPLGSLRTLTKGAGADGELIVMATNGPGIPGDFPFADERDAAVSPV